MEPPRPRTRSAILAANPNAKPEDIDEYERLLSERFRRRPQPAPDQDQGIVAVADEIESRIAELYAKLIRPRPRSRGR